ncbi:hypothetical protein HD806DRAFT_224019 [Xylariaceae sp. AK1471]|nr:hypothetical protein HD806DRAFT_224019 [Xylariaceae sp. AK1471]
MHDSVIVVPYVHRNKRSFLVLPAATDCWTEQLDIYLVVRIIGGACTLMSRDYKYDGVIIYFIAFCSRSSSHFYKVYFMLSKAHYGQWGNSHQFIYLLPPAKPMRIRHSSLNHSPSISLLLYVSSIVHMYVGYLWLYNIKLSPRSSACLRISLSTQPGLRL